MKEPRLATQAGSRKKSVQPGTSPEPAPARAVLEDISSRSAKTVSYLAAASSVLVLRVAGSSE
jgi:hypothetical protein